MDETTPAILEWVVPAVVVFVATAIVIAVAIWAIKRARRSPRARAGAEQVRARAGIALVRLDDAVDDLELEVALSGALYGGHAPTSLRRTRLNAQRVRDDAFAQFETVSAKYVHPAEIRRVANRIETQAETALAAIESARAEHAEWMAANVSASDQTEAAEQRLCELRESMGDPDALVSSMAARYDDDEWKPAARAARGALAAVAEAERHLTAAIELAADPSRTALPELAAAERSLRSAQVDARALEESHRLAAQASAALSDELAAARTAVRQAIVVREHLGAEAGERLGSEIRACDAELNKIEVDAARRPTQAVNQIARVRDRLDLAVGDANTAQQRIRGARTALPGTLAAARIAIAHAETSLGHSSTSADARSRLIVAQAALADARQVSDPVAALDAARRARLHAEDASALAEYDSDQQRKKMP
ncbi:hypothetical protein [Microbacterium sp. NPDC076911]|uniref:hypothetical protein n=1 Tax=Microbacterium sp. NPDC076911 TaxID=3154958 RepID=UPI00343ACCE2